MKHLILGDCDYLIKYILFEDSSKNEKDEETKEKISNEKREIQNKSEIKCLSIPTNTLWPGEELDDLVPDDKLEEINPKNNMELAICHCKGKFDY